MFVCVLLKKNISHARLSCKNNFFHVSLRGSYQSDFSIPTILYSYLSTFYELHSSHAFTSRVKFISLCLLLMKESFIHETFNTGFHSSHSSASVLDKHSKNFLSVLCRLQTCIYKNQFPSWYPLHSIFTHHTLFTHFLANISTVPSHPLIAFWFALFHYNILLNWSPKYFCLTSASSFMVLILSWHGRCELPFLTS